MIAEHHTSGRVRLEQIVPVLWRPGLVRLDPGTKKPTDVGFNPDAHARWLRGEGVDLDLLEEWIDQGGHVGMVPPPGTIVVDVDNAEAEAWIRSIMSPYAPLRRTRRGIHVYARVVGAGRCDEVTCIQVQKQQICGQIIDLRVWAKGQSVILPATHTDVVGVNPFEVPLPDDPRELPTLPNDLKDGLVLAGKLSGPGFLVAMSGEGYKGNGKTRPASVVASEEPLDAVTGLVGRYFDGMRLPFERLWDSRSPAVASNIALRWDGEEIAIDRHDTAKYCASRIYSNHPEWAKGSAVQRYEALLSGLMLLPFAEDPEWNVRVSRGELRRIAKYFVDKYEPGLSYIEEIIPPEPLTVLEKDEVDSIEWENFQPAEVPQEPFPIEALTPELRDVVKTIDYAIEVDPGYTASVMLGVVAAATMARVKLRAKDDWSLYLNLFVLAVMASGESKSAVMALLRAELARYELKLQKDMANSVAVAQENLRALKDEQTVIRGMLVKERAKGFSGDTSKIADCSDRLEVVTGRVVTAEASLPVTPRLLIEDCTPQAIVKIIGQRSRDDDGVGVLALITDEGTTFFEIAMGMYSAGQSQTGTSTKLYTGAPLTVDRVDSEGVAAVMCGVLTCVLAVQPAVVERVREDPRLRELGLIPRFCISATKSRVGGRLRKGDRCVDPEVMGRYEAVLIAIAERVGGASAPIEVKLSVAARERFFSYLGALEAERGVGRQYANINDFVTRHEEQVLKLSGLLHVWDCIAQDVEEGVVRSIDVVVDIETLERGLVIGRWFLGEELRVFGQGAESGGKFSPQLQDDLDRVMGAVEAIGTPMVSRRDVQVRTGGGHGTTYFSAKRLDAALKAAMDIGYLKESQAAPEDNRPGPQRRRFAVHPDFLEHG